MKLAAKAWFCLAVATIAAVIGDFIVEDASNHGIFGPGDFTDHSSWILSPALLAGSVFIALHLFHRLRDAQLAQVGPSWLQLTRNAIGSNAWSLIPLVFAIQLVTLFTMERTEQLVVYGHFLPGAIWLGGPIVASLSIHALLCCLVTLTAASLVRILANATVQLVKLVRTFATLGMRGFTPHYFLHKPDIASGRSVRVICRIGERAPPLFTA
jgi:hypothetical protein